MSPSAKFRSKPCRSYHGSTIGSKFPSGGLIMRTLFAFFLCLVAATAPLSIASAQAITKATITFHTTSDDKDGDSQVRDRIVCNGQDFLKLECCSAGKHSASDHWGDNSTTSRDMSIVSPLDKARVTTCNFVAGLTAVGNDRWIAIYTLDLTFQDGSKAQYSFGEIPLNSQHSSLVEVTKPIR